MYIISSSSPETQACHSDRTEFSPPSIVGKQQPPESKAGFHLAWITGSYASNWNHSNMMALVLLLNFGAGTMITQSVY
jgi:hypothetical protein